jgi:Ca-activated chloride channel family protein
LVEDVAMNYFKFITSRGDIYELSQPEWLWLIPLLIIIILATRLIKNKYISKSAPASFSDVSSKQLLLHPLLNVFQVNESATKINPPSRVLYSFISLILILTLTQPIRIGEKLPDPPQERDITFIVDTSVSMILRDYILNGERIDRMSLLKGVLDDFIRKLKGERMSIIVFGDQAYTLVPLTTDQSLLRKMLSRVQATMAGRFNAIGDAIALAVKQSQQINNKKDESKKRKRILVLLTDADQPTGEIDPVIAAQLAKNANLPLYTIAIGATSLAAEESRLGGLLYSPVDLNLIQKLSSITHAKSYQAGNPKALEKAIQAISLHETNKREVKVKYYHEPLYHWLLIAAFIFFTLSQIVNILKLTLAPSSNTTK